MCQHMRLAGVDRVGPLEPVFGHQEAEAQNKQHRSPQSSTVGPMASMAEW